MRNLKRALSLGLTAAMISGLMVMGSSAASSSYTDVADTDNVEAIEVLKTVGIMVGDENGDFNPDQNVTRNEMAVIMSKLMEYNVANYKNISPFTDVPSWASDYVAACYTNGITAGYSDTIYGGSDSVTTAQAALMLMKALGYFQYASDFGADWQLTTTKQANDIDLFVGVDSGVEEAMTRNDVAQLVLNTLKAGTVQAETNGSLTVGNVTIATDVKYNYITSNQPYATAIDDARSTSSTTDAGRSIVELGEKLYNGDLKLDEDTTDVFGRPARTWSYDGEEIGTFAQKELLAAEFTTAVSGKELYDVIGKTAFDKYDFESYVDGKENDFYKEISRNNKDDVSETGNGALTQVFVDIDKETVTATVINTYLADAMTDYNTKKEEVDFKIWGLTGAKTDILTVSAEDFYIEDVTEDDFVLVTYSHQSEDIESISDVEILSDMTVTKFTSDDKGSNSGNVVSSVTAEGTKYDASNTLTYEEGTLKDYTASNLKDKTYNIYLDQYGYAIGVEEVEGADNYLFLTGINGGTDYLATANYDANVIFLDGTSDVVKVKSNDDVRDAITGATTSQALVNKWFKYSVNSNDVYTLTEIDANLNSGKNDLAQNQTVATMEAPGVPGVYDTIDDRHISLLGGTGDGKIYGNEDTVYLVADLDTVSVTEDTGNKTYGVIADADEVIVGVDNVSIEVWDEDYVKGELTPAKGTAPDAVSHSTYALYDDSGVIIAAVVVGESAGTSSSVAYVISSKASEERFENGVWGWTREVVIDGKLVDLNEVDDDDTTSILADEMQPGQWYTVKFDADGNVKRIVPFDDPVEYVTELDDAVTQLRDEDLVVMQIDDAVAYSKNGRTIYNWGAKTEDNGIFVDSDVQFVIRQENKNKTTTEEYTGWNQMKSALDTLNTTLDYEFNAVIENGRITSVVIIDRAGDGFVGPDSHKDVDVDMTDDSKINIRFYGAANEPDKDEAIELIEAYFEDQGYTATKKTAGKDTYGNPEYTWTLENAKGYELGTYTFKYHSNYIKQEFAIKVVCDGLPESVEATPDVQYACVGEIVKITITNGGNNINSNKTLTAKDANGNACGNGTASDGVGSKTVTGTVKITGAPNSDITITVS